MRLLLMLLLLAGGAWAGPGREAAGWIGSLAGVTAGESREQDGLYTAAYRVSAGQATLESIRAGLMKRGWMVDTAPGLTTFRARKGGLRMEVSLNGSELGVRVSQARAPGQPGTLPLSGAGTPSAGEPRPAPPAPTPEPRTQRVLPDSHQTGDLQCSGEELVIKGSHCVYRLFGNCPSLTVAGSENTISIPGRIDHIRVVGGRNRILWSGSANPNAPSLLDEGPANRVERN